MKENLKTIGNYAFFNFNSIEFCSVIIPAGVISLGRGVFYGCNYLNDITFECNASEGVLAGSYLINLTYKGNIETYRLFDTVELENYPVDLPVNIPDVGTYYVPLKIINKIVFTEIVKPYSCYGFSYKDFFVHFAGVTQIGNYAFGECSKLSNIDLDNTVANIGIGAFENCMGLKTIKFNNNTMNIGENILIGCNNIENIYLADNMIPATFFGTTLDNLCYAVDVNGTSYYVPYSLQLIGFSDNATIIYSKACANLISITYLSINNISVVGDFAFENCTGLTKFNINDNNFSYGESILSGCKNISNISIAENVIVAQLFGQTAFTDSYAVEIGEITYYVPLGLKAVEFNDSIIGNYACYGLSSLMLDMEHNLISNVTDIGNYAFYGCTGLTELTFTKNINIIGNNAFENCSNLFRLNFKQISEIGTKAFYNCSYLNSIVIMEVLYTDVINEDTGNYIVQVIPGSDQMFDNCPQLTISISCSEESLMYFKIDIYWQDYSDKLEIYFEGGDLI